ncbi:MAG: PHA/PHB synthase family protein [Holosporales bacterium]
MDRTKAADKGQELSAFQDSFAQELHALNARWTRVLTLFADPNMRQEDPILGNLSALSTAFAEATQKALSHPHIWQEPTKQYLHDMGLLWTKSIQVSTDPTLRFPEIASHLNDKRFVDDAWREVPTFSFMRQSYLLWQRWLHQIFQNVQGLDEKKLHKAQFFLRQVIDAASPNNYFWANPKVLQKMFESGGMSLLRGFDNFLRDIEAGHGTLDINMVNRDAFQLGVNIAKTKGAIVYQNDLVQVIQYEATTPKVHKIPVLLVPPCINKFYIFDLREENSFVRWLCEQGYTVFIISWVNPDQKLARKSFEDYVFEGIGASIKAIQDICQSDLVHAVGYCIGGNFLSCLSAYMADENKNPLASTTYLATLFDFSRSGDLQVFIDEDQLRELEERVRSTGFLEGRMLARTFNLLRANDLIWSFFINNYLLGEDPSDFDLLYWNSDSTNLPAAMYTFYLRNMFLENKLIQPGGLTLKGKAVDLGKIKIPTFILSTSEDHIAPWHCGYAGARAMKGPTRFVLGGSGHVAGIFNSPHKPKYGYWVGNDLPESHEAWLKAAHKHHGSWWQEWLTWVNSLQQEMVPARGLGSAKHPVLEAAPGSYATR